MRQQAQVNERFLKRQRRKIETIFSRWNQLFDIERNRARCLAGFQIRISMF